MATTAVSVDETCRAAKRAARELQTLSSAVKDAALEAIADALIERDRRDPGGQRARPRSR